MTKSGKPMCVDLFCGLGGWSAGFRHEGFYCVGFDIEVHAYVTGRYPGDLVVQDVKTLNGGQFSYADVIVASPPCQKYSWMAMPWSRAKAKAAWYREEPARQAGLNELFNACFRIQREASDAAGRHIPLIVENVKGAQPWVGSANWHYGSYYLWGDVPMVTSVASVGLRWSASRKLRKCEFCGYEFPEDLGRYGCPNCNGEGLDCVKQHGSGAAWFDNGLTRYSSRSAKRKAASAEIARIPFPLSHAVAKWVIARMWSG